MKVSIQTPNENKTLAWNKTTADDNSKPIIKCNGCFLSTHSAEIHRVYFSGLLLNLFHYFVYLCVFFFLSLSLLFLLLHILFIFFLHSSLCCFNLLFSLSSPIYFQTFCVFISIRLRLLRLWNFLCIFCFSNIHWVIAYCILHIYILRVYVYISKTS